MKEALQRITRITRLEAAAHAASMDVRHWRKVEAGEHGATLRTLAKIGVALGIEPNTLLR